MYPVNLSLPQFYDDYGQPHPCRAACQMEQARTLYARAQAVLDQAQRLAGRTTEGEPVSQALWCDQGNHAFSARDLKAEHWERRVKDSDGQPIVIPWDVCGTCLAKMPGAPQGEPVAAIDG